MILPRTSFIRIWIGSENFSKVEKFLSEFLHLCSKSYLDMGITGCDALSDDMTSVSLFRYEVETVPQTLNLETPPSVPVT